MLKCAPCTKLCTRLSRVWAYFKPVATVSLPLSLVSTQTGPDSRLRLNIRRWLDERTKCRVWDREGKPSESVQQTVAPSVYSKLIFFWRPPPMKLNCWGSANKVKYVWIIFFWAGHCEGEWQQRAFSPTLWRHRRGWKMQSLGSENCQALSFSRLPAPTIRVRARQCLKVQADDCWQERERGSLDMYTAMGLRELSSLAIQVFLSGNFDDKGTSHSQSTITHFRRSTQYTPRIEDIWLDIYCEFSTEMTILKVLHTHIFCIYSI